MAYYNTHVRTQLYKYTDNVKRFFSYISLLKYETDTPTSSHDMAQTKCLLSFYGGLRIRSNRYVLDNNVLVEDLSKYNYVEPEFEDIFLEHGFLVGQKPVGPQQQRLNAIFYTIAKRLKPELKHLEAIEYAGQLMQEEQRRNN